jgi:type I restriction enzyme S subunit
MEVKPGYKQTEVGVIPEEWGVSPFQEVTEIITCGLAATPTYVPESVGKPFLSAQNVRKGHVVLDNHRFISIELFEQITRHNKPKRGDLLYTRVGAGIGEAGIVESDIEFGIYVSLTLIRTDSRRLHSGFAAHLLNSNSYQARAKGGQFAGGGVQNLNVEVVRKFPIPLPSPEEQRAIATALSDMDGLLGGLDRLIAKKRDLKQAAMQQLLTGQTRLPGFHDDWEVRRLGDVLTVRHGKSQHGITAPDGKYPILASGGEIGRTDSYIYDKPSVLIGRKGTIDSPQYVDIPFWTVDTLFFTEISREADAKFVFYKFTMIRWRSYNEASGVPSLNAKTIENIEVTIPPLPEQRAIAEVLTEMDGELAVLEQRREKTRALKQAMMQELLTGRIRLV